MLFERKGFRNYSLFVCLFVSLIHNSCPINFIDFNEAGSKCEICLINSVSKVIDVLNFIAHIKEVSVRYVVVVEPKKILIFLVS